MVLKSEQSKISYYRGLFAYEVESERTNKYKYADYYEEMIDQVDESYEDYFILSLCNFNFTEYENLKNNYLLSDVYRMYALSKVHFLQSITI